MQPNTLLNAKTGESQVNPHRLVRLRLARAVRALELADLTQPFQRVPGDHVPARHHHWRVLVGRLLLGHRANKDGMEAVSRGQLNLNLSWPD